MTGEVERQVDEQGHEVLFKVPFANKPSQQVHGSDVFSVGQFRSRPGIHQVLTGRQVPRQQRFV